MASYVWAWHQLRPMVMQSGDSGMERPGVYPVEVATVLNMCTVTGGGQVVLEIQEELDSFVYIFCSTWLLGFVMERDSAGRRGDGPENLESAERKT